MKNVIQITDKILGVIVPEKASDFEFIHDKTRIGYKVDYRLFKIELPKGNFKIHGTCTLPNYDFDFEVDESWVLKEIRKHEVYYYLNYIETKMLNNEINMFNLKSKEQSFRTRIQKAIQDEGIESKTVKKLLLIEKI